MKYAFAIPLAEMRDFAHLPAKGLVRYGRALVRRPKFDISLIFDAGMYARKREAMARGERARV